MTLGLVARADNSGLATQTWELWRHMNPERTLIVLSDHLTRGPCQADRYENGGAVRITRRYPSTKDAKWLCSDTEVIFSAECFYTDKIPAVARMSGARTVLQANPELFDPWERPDVIVAPTPWRLDVFPEGTAVLPVPVALERFPIREARPVTTFYHVHSTAMEDRNGTELVLQAAGRMGERCRILIRGEGEPWMKMYGRVEVRWLPPFSGPYYEHWPEEVDALVLPRRYGGLCLPFHEAAALGLPVVMLSTDPYATALPREYVVPGELLKTEPMKGGRFDIHTCSPGLLAATMDAMVSDGVAAGGVMASLNWARSHSWLELGPRYERLLS